MDNIKNDLVERIDVIENIIEKNKRLLSGIYSDKEKNENELKKLKDKKKQHQADEINKINTYQKISTFGSVISPILLISISIVTYYFHDLIMLLSLPAASLIYTASLNGVIKEEIMNFEQRIKAVDSEIEDVLDRIRINDEDIKSIKKELSEINIIILKAKKLVENNKQIKKEDNINIKVEKIIFEDKTSIPITEEEIRLKLQKTK